MTIAIIEHKTIKFYLYTLITVFFLDLACCVHQIKKKQPKSFCKMRYLIFSLCANVDLGRENSQHKINILLPTNHYALRDFSTRYFSYIDYTNLKINYFIVNKITP